MPTANWEFFIDVGGTFTDVVARRPDGKLVTHKLLSSSAVRGVAEHGSSSTCIQDSRRIGDPEGFWTGYRVTLLGMHPASPLANMGAGASAPTSCVSGFDSDTGRLFLEKPLEPFGPELCAYELRSEEEAPVLAIRYLMGIGLYDPIGPVEVRLGTTRATNALLERKGAKVALVTTKGFADILKIGNQDRPKLFELNIRKRDELTRCVVEIDERLSATGEVLRSPDEKAVRAQLEEIKASGIETLAICLMHAHVNPANEDIVACAAESVGFGHLSASSRVARLEKLVPRGDTTVVDAYLAPVIQDHVASLRRSMPEANVKLMSSSGGLVPADAAAGKDTILSGPAGGVVGCRHVARAAGFAKTIGFDMGGTSTDVSRIDEPPNEFEYQHETVKAGVRIMTPMLAVETVAAGGGSICAFDGQKLTVGPESAGADPGPVCYGRGGPLTVTDMNVFLGRVVPEHFPFRLDRPIVEHKLRTLCEEVNAATGSKLGPVELAEGFIKIANANMTSAIKRISMAKGYDVREYALTTFGGAGAQHACAMARMLGMSRVLCSPFAGVLSAVGIGVADIKRIGQRSVNQPLDAKAATALEPIFQSITDKLRHTMIIEGIEPSSLSPPACTTDMCYAGQSTLITVPADAFSRARERFEGLHRQLYGYCHEGRAIEIRVVRVEVTARSAHLATEISGRAGRQPAGRRTTAMVVNGRQQTVPLYLRSELGTGERFTGPAIVIEDTSTIVVEPGWEAVVADTGDIVLTDIEAAPTHEAVSAEVDPIQLELFNNQFVSVAEQMGTTLRRTALSVNVKERLDFSCAVFTPEGDLVVNAPHIPVHLGGMSNCVKALMEDVGRF
ncbi:MAG: hydantoinase B/oxoprolinase family protein, partial [Phycisphaerales bacterium]